MTKRRHRSAARTVFRAATLTLSLAAAATFAVACGNGTDTTEPGAGAAAPVEEGAFPVTIDHAYGSTPITEAPQRVAAVGLADADALLALDVTPVLVTPWSGATDAGVGEWALPELDGARPVVHDYTDGINIELIASTSPDLIVAINQSVDEQTYEQLSSIAPTIVRPAEAIDWGVSWQDATRIIGSAVGQPARADEIIADTEELFAQVRSDHPEIVEKTGAVMLLNQAGGYYTYTEEDGRGQFMKALGFELPDQLRALEDGQFYVDVSAENAQLLETDILIVLPNHDAAGVLSRDDAFQATGVARDGRYIVVDAPTGIAMSMATVLSIPYALDRVVPEITERIS